MEMDKIIINFLQGTELSNYKGLGRWARITRAPFLQASVIPVLVAGALAFKNGEFELFPFIIALLAIVMVHLGVNTANDYYDHLLKADEINIRPTPFSGGSRVIQEELEDPKTVLLTAVVFFVSSVIFGSYLIYLRGLPLLYIGLLGVIFGFFYTAPPLKLVYRGLGELTVFILLGPLAVIGGYLAVTGRFSYEALMASIPVGIWVMLILLANEFPDEEFDRKAGKNHWVVLLGKGKSAYVYGFFAYFSFIFVVVIAVLGRLPWTAILTLLAFPFAHAAADYFRRNASGDNFLFAQEKTIQTHLFMGLLLTLSFIIARFI